MRTKTHALDYYRRMLASRNHAMKRLDEHAKIMLFAKSQEISASPDSVARWHCVISGAARRSAIRSDGRRQILDLMLPGDFFVLVNRHQEIAVEAMVEDTALASYSGQSVEQLAQRDAEFARELREVAFQELCRIQDQLLTLGGVTAIEKLSSFLLALESRSSSSRRDEIVLPLTRYDIAEYLALSVETVCRSFTCLRQCGAIALAGKRRIKILDRNVLAQRRAAAAPASGGNSRPTPAPERVYSPEGREPSRAVMPRRSASAS